MTSSMRGHGNEAFYGQAAYGDDEGGFEKDDFLAEPLRAVGDLGGVRDAVAAGAGAARETAADGGHVDVGSEHVLGDAGPLVEPTEEALAGSPCEGAAHDWLADAGGLADKNDAAEDWSAGDWRRRASWGRGGRPRSWETWAVSWRWREAREAWSLRGGSEDLAGDEGSAGEEIAGGHAALAFDLDLAKQDGAGRAGYEDAAGG